MDEWSEPERLLKTWLDRASDGRNGHRVAGKYYASLHWCVGGSVIALSAALSTTLIADVQKYDVGRPIVIA